jgi:hypothetical protein
MMVFCEMIRMKEFDGKDKPSFSGLWSILIAVRRILRPPRFCRMTMSGRDQVRDRSLVGQILDSHWSKTRANRCTSGASSTV